LLRPPAREPAAPKVLPCGRFYAAVPIRFISTLASLCGDAHVSEALKPVPRGPLHKAGGRSMCGSGAHAGRIWRCLYRSYTSVVTFGSDLVRRWLNHRSMIGSIRRDGCAALWKMRLMAGMY